MAYSQETEHYELPQFQSSDIPTWSDLNTAFSIIDAALYNISQQSGISAQQAQALIDTSISGAVFHDAVNGTGITSAQYSKLKVHA